MTLCSIIGDGELNFRVRNGVGCTLSSMATKEISGHLLKSDCVARRFALGHGRLCPFPSLSTCAPCHISKSALKYDMQSKRCVVNILIRGGRILFEKQDARAISTGQLHASRRFHLRPINEVVYLGPSGLASGRTYLKAGFPLRCFQRLSLPHLATLLCRWHDNRSTSGVSIPVLSY